MRTITITLKDISNHGTIAEAVTALSGGVSGEATVSIPEPTTRAAMRHPGAFLAWFIDGPRFGLAHERANAVADAVLGAYAAIAVEEKRKSAEEKAKRKLARPARAIDNAVERRGLIVGRGTGKSWDEQRAAMNAMQRKIGRRAHVWQLGLEEMP